MVYATGLKTFNLGETIELFGNNLKSSKDFRPGREFSDNQIKCITFTNAEIKLKDIKIREC